MEGLKKKIHRGWTKTRRREKIRSKNRNRWVSSTAARLTAAYAHRPEREKIENLPFVFSQGGKGENGKLPGEGSGGK